MQTDAELRPVAEGDLARLYRLTSDPAATGEHEWLGWQDPWALGRRWEDDGLLGEAARPRVITLCWQFRLKLS